MHIRPRGNLWFKFLREVLANYSSTSSATTRSWVLRWAGWILRFIGQGGKLVQRPWIISRRMLHRLVEHGGWILRIADPCRRSWGILLIRSFSLSGASNFTCHSCIISFAWQACQTRGWPTLKVIISLFNPQVLGFGWGATPKDYRGAEARRSQAADNSINSNSVFSLLRVFHDNSLAGPSIFQEMSQVQHSWPAMNSHNAHLIVGMLFVLRFHTNTIMHNYATNEAFTFNDS